MSGLIPVNTAVIWYGPKPYAHRVVYGRTHIRYGQHPYHLPPSVSMHEPHRTTSIIWCCANLKPQVQLDFTGPGKLLYFPLFFIVLLTFLSFLVSGCSHICCCLFFLIFLSLFMTFIFFIFLFFLYALSFYFTGFFFYHCLFFFLFFFLNFSFFPFSLTLMCFTFNLSHSVVSYTLLHAINWGFS